MTLDISIILPARDEAGNIGELLSEIGRVMADTDHEIVVIDDASSDGTRQVLALARRRMPQLRVICHESACGQSAAIRTGVMAARGRLIATLDADGQNPPGNLPALLAPLLQAAPEARIGLVQGQRVNRQDTWSKRWASRFANRVRNALLHDGVSDSGCGLKAFPRDVYLSLPFFDHIHRFMPAMVHREGWNVVTVPVTHAERLSGRSKYSNLQRGLVGIVDLLGAAWLTGRRKLPQTHELPMGLADTAGKDQPPLPRTRTAIVQDPVLN
ncbi:glycosyltransferase family 2 protein [Paracoccus aurantiacus]|uniref:Glycosyltransferase family 2 protein n=1 Tax=Paracoccus aurantiacus TaxID=2599412 RepID=A0A5C6S6C2_9RHOB|nr:glycosyltransferase family 2 protein [Paracoccus aurantiacus]TXB69362.1 glycosyltransferase family 2 protein [Paracoccus aurantiacus]